MDLRPFIKQDVQIQKAKELVIKGLINYQPFIFADDLEVGAGYEFLAGEYSGMVYWPTINLGLLQNPSIKRFIISNENKNQFTENNQRLRVMYDTFVDEICSRIGDVSKTTFADVGCNAGYFPISFSLRGAMEAVGYDRENFTECFNLLNGILDTNAKFIHSSYDSRTQTIPGCKSYDVIISIAVLCHLSDPLQHLGFLGSFARRAIFIWTPVTDDDDYCIRFGEPNKYYKADKFPSCFDNNTRPSAKLLRKSLELIGFTDIYEIPNKDGGMPDGFYKSHKAFLAMRPSSHNREGDCSQIKAQICENTLTTAHVAEGDSKLMVETISATKDSYSINRIKRKFIDYGLRYKDIIKKIPLLNIVLKKLYHYMLCKWFLK